MTHQDAEQAEPQRVLADAGTARAGAVLTAARYARLSLYYLLYYTSVAVYAPYFNLFLSERGLTNAQVGVVLATIPLVGMFAQPFWGVLNDHARLHKLTLTSGIVAPALALEALLHIHCLGWVLAIVAGMAVFQAAVIPLADALTVQQTGPRNYGKVRMFGSLGYALVTEVAARVYHVHGVAWLPHLFVVTAVLALVAVIIYPAVPPDVQASVYRNPLAGLGRVLRNRQFVLILCFTLLCSVGQGVNNNFFSLYYHALHRPLGWLGVIYGLGGLSEVPLLFLAGRLIERFGPLWVLLFATSVFTFRWFVMSTAPPTFVLLLLQLMHGMSFGLGLASGVAYAAQVSDAGNRATAQAVYSTVNTSISAIAGSLMGGWLLGAAGPQGLYLAAGVLSLAGVIGIFAVAVRVR